MGTRNSLRIGIVQTVAGAYEISGQTDYKRTRLPKHFLNQHNMGFKVNMRVEELLERYGSKEAALTQAKQIYYMTDGHYQKAIWEQVIDELSEE